jgi:hypothetical protein
VCEQLAHRDPPTIGNDPGEPPLHRVREPQTILGNELQHDHGDERLGDAAGPEPVARTEWDVAPQHRDTGRCLFPAPAVVDEHERSRASRLDHRVDRRRRRAVWPAGRARCRRHCTGNSHYDDRERRPRYASHASSLRLLLGSADGVSRRRGGRGPQARTLRPWQAGG